MANNDKDEYVNIDPLGAFYKHIHQTPWLLNYITQHPTVSDSHPPAHREFPEATINEDDIRHVDPITDKGALYEEFVDPGQKIMREWRAGKDIVDPQEQLNKFGIGYKPKPIKM